MATTVIHIKDAPENWQHDPDYVYIGRYNSHYGLKRSFWYNPYSIKGLSHLPLTDTEKRFNVINKFASRLAYNENMIYELPLLRDKILVCWCKPHACHGDVLVKWRTWLSTLSLRNDVAKETLESFKLWENISS